MDENTSNNQAPVETPVAPAPAPVAAPVQAERPQAMRPMAGGRFGTRGGRNSGRPGGRGPRRDRPQEKPEYDQRTLDIARVARVTKGGKRFSFRATVVAGNGKGRVGVGLAKGRDVQQSILKAYHQAKKNLVTLVMAYMTLARRRRLPPLVLAGPGSDWTQGGSRVGPQIVATGYLDKADVRNLMAASSMLVLPSLEEGFGLPVVEAMASGLPVVCSKGSALAEVAGDAACLVDAQDANALARAIERLLEDRELAAEMRRRGLVRSQRFDWQDTATRTLAFYRKVLGS